VCWNQTSWRAESNLLHVWPPRMIMSWWNACSVGWKFQVMCEGLQLKYWT
jgi:hypothetical protein